MVRPDECTAASERVARQMAALEQKIDQALREHYWDNGRECFVECDGSYEAAQRLQGAYSNYGWKVRLESCQREGTYMAFSKRA